VRRIKKLAPGEIIRAHLVHQPEIAAALRSKRAFVVFVYRDPRDVIVSLSHYLTDSAPWHAMHREFARRTPDQRIEVAIEGLPGFEQLFPNVGKRFGLFANWLEDADVALRFEDLVSESRFDVVETLVSSYREKCRAAFDTREITTQALAAIDPERSHTYREGRVGAWQEVLSSEHLAAFEAVASETLQRYGYASESSS
jgi:sulfotransferase 6B1